MLPLNLKLTLKAAIEKLRSAVPELSVYGVYPMRLTRIL